MYDETLLKKVENNLENENFFNAIVEMLIKAKKTKEIISRINENIANNKKKYPNNIKGVYINTYKIKYDAERHNVTTVFNNGKKLSKVFSDINSALTYKKFVLLGLIKIAIKNEHNVKISYVIKCYVSFLKNCNTYKNRTISSTLYKLNMWFKDVQDMHICDLSRKWVNERYLDRVNNVAIATQHGELKVLKLFLKWCVDNLYLNYNYANDINFVGKPNKGRAIINDYELSKLKSVLIDYAKIGVDGALVCLIIVELGFRISTVLNLKVSDLEFLSVDKLRLLSDVYVRNTYKNKYVEVEGELNSLIRNKVFMQKGGYLFPSKKDKEKPHNGTWVRSFFIKYSKLAGIGYYCPQSYVHNRFKIFQRDAFKCCYCGRSSIGDDNVILHLDHIKSFNKGGCDVAENLITACSECNMSKGNRKLSEQIIEEIVQSVKVRNKSCGIRDNSFIRLDRGDYYMYEKCLDKHELAIQTTGS